MRRLVLAVAGALALVAAVPAVAPAVGPPYSLTAGPGPGELNVQPTGGGSTLAVSVEQTGNQVTFTPAAAAAPMGCTGLVSTVCDTSLLTSKLQFSAAPGGALEVRILRVQTALLTLVGGPDADTVLVEGPATPPSIGMLDLRVGQGPDSVTVRGSVGQIQDVAALPADTSADRYVIESPAITGSLNPEGGNDVLRAPASPLLLDGGTGDDTLVGRGELRGGAGADALRPTTPGQTIDGGPGDFDRVSFDTLSAVGNLVLQRMGVSSLRVNGADTVSGVEIVEGGRGNDTLVGTSAADTLVGGEGDDRLQGLGAGDSIDGGPGSDTAAYDEEATTHVGVDLGAGTGGPEGAADTLVSIENAITGGGNDLVIGSANDDRIATGGGDDQVDGGAGSDAIDGGPGNDLLRGRRGNDLLDGGPGHDTVTYDERSEGEPVTATLVAPGSASAPGDADALVALENIVGGAGNDGLTGDDGANTLIGGGGSNGLNGLGGDDVLSGGEERDILDGGTGTDQMSGGAGDDSLQAFDGGPDLVDCGASPDDDAQVDAVDSVVACEYGRRGDVPIPVDADGDGIVAGFDCDDANTQIRPGATDIPGDRIDQNCDGFDEPVPAVVVGLSLSWRPPKASGLTITRFVLTRLTSDSSVVVTCRQRRRTPPRRCPFRRRSFKPRNGVVGLTRNFGRRTLPVGTRIEVRVTRPDRIGWVRRLTVLRAADPRDEQRCLLLRSSVPRRCPPDVE